VLSTKLLRFSALCGIFSGLFIAIPGGIEGFTGKMAVTSFILGLSPALGMPLFIALYQRHSASAGGFGAVAYAVNLIGLGLFGGAAFTQDMALIYVSKPVLNHLKHGPTYVALLGSAVVFAVGAVLFGVSLLRTRLHPRIPAWGYTVILPLFAASAPLPATPLKSGLHLLAGATLIWLAASLWSAPPTVHHETRAPGYQPRQAGPLRSH
jgi:hypothetical protein